VIEPYDISYLGPPEYEYMQRTVKGMNAREGLEVTFWTVLGFIIVLSVLIPVGIGIGTRLWAWALT